MAAAMICRFLVYLYIVYIASICLTEQRIVQIGAEIVSLREQMGTGGERHEHVFLSDMSLLQWVPGSVYVCLNCKGFSQRNQSHLRNKRVGLRLTM